MIVMALSLSICIISLFITFIGKPNLIVFLKIQWLFGMTDITYKSL